MSDSLQPHELQHTRPPCPSPTPRIYPNSCPLSQWCHQTTSSLVVPFSSITTNKASGRDGIPAELFQILRDDAVKVLQSIYQQIWKTQQWPQVWKRFRSQRLRPSGSSPIPKKGNAKECSNYHIFTFISHTSKVMFKILQARLQQYINWISKRQKNQRSNCQYPMHHRKSKRIPEKHLLHGLHQSLWLCGSQQTMGNSARGE